LQAYLKFLSWQVCFGVGGVFLVANGEDKVFEMPWE